MADAYLTFDTKLNTAGFKSGLGQVTGMFTKLAALAGIAFSVGAVVAFGKAAVQAASQAEAKFKGLDFLMKANGRSMQEATSFIQEFTADGLVPMTSAYESYKNMVSRGYSTEQIEKMLSVMKDAAVYNRQGQFSMGEAMEKATMGLRMENSLLTDSVGIQKNVAKMWQEHAQTLGTVAGSLTLAQKRQAEFNGFMKEGGVFAGAAGGYLNTYAGKMGQLTSSFTNLKVAVGNAVIPILNAILPAVNAAILWFTRLFNIIGRVMNLLFGSNVGMVDAEAAIANNAQATADATGQTAANTEAAGKAAKGALASFDKLNVLAQDTASGGGSGTGGIGVSMEMPELNTTAIEEPLDKLMAKVEELKQKFVAFFAPFIPTFENLKRGISDLWTAIQNAFVSLADPNSTLGAFALFLRDVLALALEGVSAAFAALGKWAKENPESFQGLILVFGLVAASIFSITNPIALVIVGVVALIAAITWLVKNWELVTDKAAEAVNSIVRWFSGLGEWFRTSVADPIANALTNAWETVKTVWGAAINWFQTTVIDPITTAFETAWSAISGFVTDAFGGIGETIKSALNGVIGFINGLLAGLAGGINGIINALNGISFAVPDWVPLIGGQSFGVNLRNVSVPRITPLATGAVIPPNAPFAAMMGDQRSGTNIEAPESLIRQIVREESGGGGGQNITITFGGTMGELVRQLKPYIERETSRVGGSLSAKAVRI